MQHHSSVARKVFPEATPSASVSEYEAKDVEDILAASVEEEKEEEKGDEREATPPARDPVILENVIVPDPQVVEQMEVENNEAATNNASESNDIVMAEDNVELATTSVPEANAATAPEASEATASEAPVVQHEASVAANAPVPPPRPYTIE